MNEFTRTISNRALFGVLVAFVLGAASPLVHAAELHLNLGIRDGEVTTPVEGVSCTVYDYFASRRLKTTSESDPEGRIRVNVEPGRAYTLEVHWRAEFKKKNIWQTHHFPRFVGQLVVPHNGRLEVNVTARPGAIVKGMVIDENGQPLEGARVYSPDANTIPRTGKSGKFTLHGVAPDQSTNIVVTTLWSKRPSKKNLFNLRKTVKKEDLVRGQVTDLGRIIFPFPKGRVRFVIDDPGPEFGEGRPGYDLLASDGTVESSIPSIPMFTQKEVVLELPAKEYSVQLGGVYLGVNEVEIGRFEVKPGEELTIKVPFAGEYAKRVRSGTRSDLKIVRRNKINKD